MNSTPEPLGSVDVALAHTAQLLRKNPALAIDQACEILKVVPDHPQARLLLGIAHRISGNSSIAVAALEPLAREQPNSAATWFELGIAFGDARRAPEAVAALHRALQLKPDLVDGWRLLADYLDVTGDASGADQARAHFIKTANRDPRLMAAATALCENDLPRAEALLRAHLRQHESDVAALRMLAEVGARLRRYGDAQTLLEHCLELAPSFGAARHNYALVLLRQRKPAEALRQIERLLAVEPRNPSYRNLHAAILANLGDVTESIEVYESVLKEFPKQPKVWMSLGHSLKTAGRLDDGVRAYRHAIELDSTLGEAYWSLANLKTFRFTVEDVAAMRAALALTQLKPEDRLHFEFSLGKALEDAAEYEESFAHYSTGNEIRRSLTHYDADDTTVQMRLCKAVITPELIARRAGLGAADRDPIFIVGLPRAGSTLLEQILASHSLVEGTTELPDIPSLARECFGKTGREEDSRYPQDIPLLEGATLRELGERYLSQTRAQRKTNAPYFIDKLPNNFAHVGFIHLILPNAKIVDARRHPLGCCFSAFKQHFARGQNFTYSLEDVGRYYRDYVELMAHFDAVLPGRVHRVFYEQMIGDTEAEVHRLLNYCGLPFESSCLRFYENERAVRTASSEQVRRPIFREGLDHWRHYEPWLGPLKSALGAVLAAYPNVPDVF